jgi:hypothetical protein
MKTRIIYTKFWNDNYVSELNHKEKLAFLYFITNEKVNICGIYELPDKYIKMDLGFSQGELDKIREKFIKDDKFIFIDGWIKIVNFELYNKFEGEKNERAKEKELALIPDKIIQYTYSIDTEIDRVSSGKDTPYNHKSIINNHKSEIKEGDCKGETSTLKEKVKFADYVSMSTEEYEKLVDKHGRDKTMAFIEKLNVFKGSNGKTYKSDYLAILNWVIEAVNKNGGKSKVEAYGKQYEKF